MYEAGFLSDKDRVYLRCYIKRRKTDGLSIRRANALLALDKGYKFSLVCDILEIGETTLRGWLSAYEAQGVSFLRMKDYSTREGHLSRSQEAALIIILRESPMRDTNEIRAYIHKFYKQEYSRSGCIKLMHRLGFNYKKPEQLPTQADEAKQQDFIENYEKLLNNLEANEVVYFGDAVHPDHQVRPAHGWFYKDDKPAVSSNSGRKRVNIHGAVCLENFDTPFVEAEIINADTTIALFERLEANNKGKSIIYVILEGLPPLGIMQNIIMLQRFENGCHSPVARSKSSGCRLMLHTWILSNDYGV